MAVAAYPCIDAANRAHWVSLVRRSVVLYARSVQGCAERLDVAGHAGIVLSRHKNVFARRAIDHQTAHLLQYNSLPGHTHIEDVTDDCERDRAIGRNRVLVYARVNRAEGCPSRPVGVCERSMPHAHQLQHQIAVLIASP